MARSSAKKPSEIGKKETWARHKGGGLHLSDAQSKEEMESRECKPKDLYIFHVVRVKQLPKHIAKLDKCRCNGKCMKARKVMDSNRSRGYT